MPLIIILIGGYTAKLNSFKKYFLVFSGTVSVALGIIGVFIPVLPTTPFLLLAAFCYLRSSKRLYDWLINHRILGAYIYSYMTYKAVPKKTKIGAIIFLWSTLSISALVVKSPHIRIFLLLVGIGVTVHLVALKTLSSEEIKELNELYRNKPLELEISKNE